MTSAQYAEWQAFDSLYPFDDLASDRREREANWLMYEAHRGTGKRTRPEDWSAHYQAPKAKQTPQQMFEALMGAWQAKEGGPKRWVAPKE